MPAPTDPEKRRLWIERLKVTTSAHWKGKPKSEEHKEKLRQLRLGVPKTAEHRASMSASRKGRKLTEQHKENIGVAGRGKVRSEETKKKLSIATLGKPKSEIHKEACRQAAQRKWAGHIPADLRETVNYAKWRKAVLDRDNRTCQRCGKKEGQKVVAHHIKPWAQFPDLRFDVNNGKTLCESPCHRDEHRDVQKQEVIDQALDKVPV